MIPQIQSSSVKCSTYFPQEPEDIMYSTISLDWTMDKILYYVFYSFLSSLSLSLFSFFLCQIYLSIYIHARLCSSTLIDLSVFSTIKSTHRAASYLCCFLWKDLRKYNGASLSSSVVFAVTYILLILKLGVNCRAHSSRTTSLNDQLVHLFLYF